MIRMILMALLLWTSAVYGIEGDLDKNGVVNFDDFFIFADNFGLTGEIEIADCGTTQLTGVIPDLTYIIVYGVSEKNWDGDIEPDGVVIDVDFHDEFGGYLSFRVRDGIKINATAKFYVATGSKYDGILTKKYDETYGEVDFVIQASDHHIRVPFEAYTENVEADDIDTSDPSIRRVISIIEVELTFSDGSQAAASGKDYVTLKG